MKKTFEVLAIGIILLMNMQAFSQNELSEVGDSVITPYPLMITFNKTTNLIFPYSITSVDRGSKDVLAQKAHGVENILQVKAGRKGFEETNLTVVTGDGKLYSYLINYGDNPSVLNISFVARDIRNAQALFPANEMNEAEVKTNAEKVAYEQITIRHIKKKVYGISFRLDGIYIHENVMYFRLKINNQSNINYDISQLRFFIRDQKKSKRTATQELEINPLHIYNDTSSVAGQSVRVFVFAVPKFTIPDRKYLTIQLMEKGGGRNLELSVHNKTIVKARPLSR